MLMNESGTIIRNIHSKGKMKRVRGRNTDNWICKDHVELQEDQSKDADQNVQCDPLKMWLIRMQVGVCKDSAINLFHIYFDGTELSVLNVDSMPIEGKNVPL